MSLISSRYGEVRLGRYYMATYINWSRFDPYSHVGVAGATNALSNANLGPIRSAFGTNANTTVRTDNTLQYWLPSNLGGLEGQVLLGAGEGTSNRVVSSRIGYSKGPVTISAARASTKNANTANGLFTDTDIGGIYNFEVVRVMGVWRQFRQAASRQTNTVIAAIVPVGVGEIKTSYIRMNLAGRVGATSINANDGTRLGLGYVHNLSKRTALYATAARITNDRAALFSVPGGPAVVSGGKTSSGYEAGMRHNF